MKLNWLSPLPPARSDIANYTRRLLPALCQTFDEVALWGSLPEYDASLSQFGPTATAHAVRNNWPSFNYRDYTCYNIGNDRRFHGLLLELHRQHPGIVILHDCNIHEMLRMEALENPLNRYLYLTLLLEQGGPDALQIGQRCLQAPDADFIRFVQQYPLTSHAVEAAHGVILHNQEALSSVAEDTDAPLLYTPLPYALPQQAPSPRQPHNDPYRLVIMGFLHGKNRRLFPVLEALSRFPQKQRFHLDIIGEIACQQELQQTLQHLQLSQHVSYHGFLPDAKLDQALDQADLAINLRNPSHGESSGSLLRYWAHALPTLVTRTAWYSKLPPETVAWVGMSDDEEQADIHAHLAAFLKQPQAYYAMGQAGYQHLCREHSPEQFVTNLLSFLSEVDSYRGRALTRPYARKLANYRINEWPTLAAREHLVNRVSQELTSWF